MPPGCMHRAGASGCVRLAGHKACRGRRVLKNRTHCSSGPAAHSTSPSTSPSASPPAAGNAGGVPTDDRPHISAPLQHAGRTPQPATSSLHVAIHAIIVIDLGLPVSLANAVFDLASTATLVPKAGLIRQRAVQWLRISNIANTPRLDAEQLLIACPAYLSLEPQAVLPTLRALHALLPDHDLTNALIVGHRAIAAGEHAATIAAQYKSHCKRLFRLRNLLPYSFALPSASPSPQPRPSTSPPPAPHSLADVDPHKLRALCSHLGTPLTRKLLQSCPHTTHEDPAAVVERFAVLHQGLFPVDKAQAVAAMCMHQPALLATAAPTLAARLQHAKGVLRRLFPREDQAVAVVRSCPWVLTQPVGVLPRLLQEMAALVAHRPSWQMQWRRATPRLVADYLRDSARVLCLLECASVAGVPSLSLRAVVQKQGATYAQLLHHFQRCRWPELGTTAEPPLNMAAALQEAAAHLPPDWEDDFRQVLDICRSRDPPLHALPLEVLRRRYTLVHAELPTALQRHVVELASRCPWLLRMPPEALRRMFQQLHSLCATRRDWELQSLALRPVALVQLVACHGEVLLRLEYLVSQALPGRRPEVTLQQVIGLTEREWVQMVPEYRYWLRHAVHRGARLADRLAAWRRQRWRRALRRQGGGQQQAHGQQHGGQQEGQPQLQQGQQQRRQQGQSAEPALPAVTGGAAQGDAGAPTSSAS